MENFKANRKGFQPAEPTDDAEAQRHFRSIQGDFICRHHNEPRVQLHVPKEETSFIPLKHIDVTRSTHTDLDVLQEKRIDDYGMSIQSNIFQIFGENSQKFTLPERRTSKRVYVVRRETDKDPINYQTRPNHAWPEVWTKIGEVGQNQENKKGQKRVRSSRPLED